MTRILVLVAMLLVHAPWVRADEPYFRENPNGAPGGFTFIVSPSGERIASFGGIFLPMRLKVRDYKGGPATRITYPSMLHSPVGPPNPNMGRGYVRVFVPEPGAVVYVNGELTDSSGLERVLATDYLEAGHDHLIRLQAGFRSGDQLLIQERAVVVRAGETASVTFDGAGALAVPLPR